MAFREGIVTGYGCPFCPVRLEADVPVEQLLRTAFEAHLDTHMARGDELLATADRALPEAS